MAYILMLVSMTLTLTLKTFERLVHLLFLFFRSAKMRDSEYQKLRAHYAELVTELDLSNTTSIDLLFNHNVLNETDKDELNKILISQEKNRRLLEILRTKEDAAYGQFRDVLQDQQPHLAKLLDPPGIPRARSSTARGAGKVCSNACRRFAVCLLLANLYSTCDKCGNERTQLEMDHEISVVPLPVVPFFDRRTTMNQMTRLRVHWEGNISFAIR